MKIAALNRLMLIAALSSLALAAPSQAQVGVTSTSIGKPVGTPPSRDERILYVGTDVYSNEAIRTGPDDRAHLLFTDGTALSIGPNSQLAIDRYVYDPDKRTGNLAVTVNKGVFRLVGGNITKSSEAVIKTPAATIGIRGGISVVDATNIDAVKAFFLFGELMRVTTPTGEQVARRPGSVVEILGGLLGDPRLASRIELTQAKAPLERPLGSQPAQGPGTPTATSIDQALAQSGVGATNSNLPPQAIAPSRESTVQSAASLASQLDSSVDDAGGRSGQRIIQLPPGPRTVDIGAQGRFVATPAYTSFDPATLAAARRPDNNEALSSANVVDNNAVVLTTESGATFVFPWAPGTATLLSSANTGSTFGPLSGFSLSSPGGDFFAYVFAPDSDPDRIGGVFGGTPTPTASFPTAGFAAHVLVGIQTPTFVSAAPFLPEADALLPVVQGAYNSPLLSVYSPNAHVGAISGSSTPNQRAVAMQVTLGLSGTGTGQSSYIGLLLGGYTTDYTKPDAMALTGTYIGSLRTAAGERSVLLTSAASTLETKTGTAIYGANADYMVLGPDALLTTDVGSSSRTTQAAARQPATSLTPTSSYYPVTIALPAAVPEGLGALRTSRTMYGYAGGDVEVLNAFGDFYEYGLRNLSPTDVTITTDASTNLVAATFSVLANGDAGKDLTLQLGSLAPGGKVSSAFIDDKNFAVVQNPATGSTYFEGNPANARIFAVTQSTVPVQSILPSGVSYCSCEYLAWGYWAGDVYYPTGPRAGETDHVHLGTWVAGELSSVAQIPTTGTATYNGHIVGSVINGGNYYLAAGAFQHNWNFGTRSGTVAVTQFDGNSYFGTSTAPTTPRDFTVALTGAGRVGEMNGSFFRSPTDPVAYQAGSFRIFGEGYKATGTFAAKR